LLSGKAKKPKNQSHAEAQDGERQAPNVPLRIFASCVLWEVQLSVKAHVVTLCKTHFCAPCWVVNLSLDVFKIYA
jgi:hypothetical protein